MIISKVYLYPKKAESSCSTACQD